MNRYMILLAFIVLNVSIYAQTSPQIKVFCDNNQSVITYSMNHPLHSWSGTNKNVTSLILTDKNKSVISQVAVSVRIADFDSQNANRDSHTMEVTEALRFPTITFSSTSIKADGDKLKVTGTITFHGVKQTITFDAIRKMDKNSLTISGTFTIKQTQFGVEPPSLMGMATDDDIKIDFVVVY